MVRFGLAALLGCSFPDVTLIQDSAAPTAGGGAGGQPGSPESGGAGGATGAAMTGGAPGTGGGLSAGGGGGECRDLDDDGEAAVACGGTDCDDDGDGFDSDVARCGGQDCYDENPAAKPGPAPFFQVPRGDGSFDYDCDGTETQQYDVGCQTCEIGSQRFEYSAAIGCGEPGTLYACNLLGGCQDGAPAVMGCR